MGGKKSFSLSVGTNVATGWVGFCGRRQGQRKRGHAGHVKGIQEKKKKARTGGGGHRGRKGFKSTGRGGRF